MSIIRASLTVYVRHGCHLCEDLVRQLHDLQEIYDFEWTEIDVDSSKQLAETYGPYVPVVMLDETRICEYFLDQMALLKALGVTN
ncbi:MAG: glutaredoxin family protein [Gammaproteobacteria bacterium]|nr:MAG: glutaredoxin family protein [Gammaproteobacteria bacterium]